MWNTPPKLNSYLPYRIECISVFVLSFAHMCACVRWNVMGRAIHAEDTAHTKLINVEYICFWVMWKWKGSPIQTVCRHVAVLSRPPITQTPSSNQTVQVQPLSRPCSLLYSLLSVYSVVVVVFVCPSVDLLYCEHTNPSYIGTHTHRTR